MMTDTTRRSILRAAGFASASLAIPAIAAPRSAPTLSPKLAALIAATRAAEHASDEHQRLIHDPARDRAKAAIEAIPHTTINAGPSFSGGEVIWSTTKPSTVAIARSIVSMAREGKDMAGAGLVHARRVVAAQLRRERAITRIERDSGYAEAGRRWDELASAISDAQCAVAGHPVSTGADLAAKLAFMIERQMGDGMDWLEELHADARRIVGLEG